jgi:hypothetical protein
MPDPRSPSDEAGALRALRARVTPGACALVGIFALAGCTLNAMGEGVPEPGATDGGADAVTDAADATAEASGDAWAEADSAGEPPVDVDAPEVEPDSGDANEDEAETTPVVADQCPGEVMVLAGSGGDPRVGSVSATTAGMGDHLQGLGACSAAPGADGVYAFQSDVTGIATILLTAAGADAMLYVRTDCAAAGSQLACSEKAGTAAETLQLGVKQGTSYYIIVDSAGVGAPFPFDLSITIQPLDLLEVCPGAQIEWTGTGSSDRTADLSGTTAAAVNDESSSCAAPLAVEQVYAVSADTDGILRLHLTPTGWNAALAVRSDCGAPATELVCKNEGGYGQPEDAELWMSAGDTWHVLVEGADASAAGPYALHATLSPRTAHESCPGEPAQWAGAGSDPRVFTVSDDTSKHWADAAGTCGATSARDTVWALNAVESGIMTVELTPVGWDAALYVRTDCTAFGSELACKDATGYSGKESYTFWAQKGVTYFAFVTGASSTQQGAYSLQATLVPMPDDETCPGEAVTWTGSGSNDRTAALSGDTTGNWNDAAGSCSASVAPDTVYALTADTDGILRLQMTPTAWDGSLYVRTSCDVPGSEVACKNLVGYGAAEKLELWAPSGSTWYAFVDGAAAGAKGAYALNATLSPRKADESCPGESAIWSGSGTQPRTFSASDDTSVRWHDAGGTCGSTSGKDTVYALAADTDGILEVTVTPVGWDAAMYIRSDCGAYGSELGCKEAAGYGAAERHVLWATKGAVYYVFVTGSTSAGQGAYTLQATLSPALPEEKCPGMPVVMAGTPLAATVTGDIAALWGDETGSCTTTSGHDAVYHVTALQSGTLTFTVTPTAFDAALIVRTASCTGVEVACKNAGGYGQPETVGVTTTAGTDLFVIVDAQGTYEGTYTLKMSY